MWYSIIYTQAKTKAMNTGCGMHQAAAAVVESTDIINRSWISAFDTCRNQTFSGDYISKALESQEASLFFCLLAAWLAGSLYMLYSSISWKTFFLLPPSPHTVQWATQKGTHYTQSLSCSKPWQQSEKKKGKKNACGIIEHVCLSHSIYNTFQIAWSFLISYLKAGACSNHKKW